MDDSTKKQADDLVHEGLELFQNRQFSQSLQTLQQALWLYRSVGNREWESNTLGILGNLCYHLQDYQRAIDYSQQNLAIAQELEDYWGETQAWINLGNSYQSICEYGSALECHQKSLALALRLPDKECEGQALTNLGNLYYALGEYEQALAAHQASLAILQSLGDHQHEGETWSNLGIAYFACDSYEEAIQCFEQSLVLAEALKDFQGVMDVVANLGAAHYAVGEYERAKSYSLQHLALAKAYSDRVNEVRALNNLHLGEQALGNSSQAITGLQKALSIAEELEDTSSKGQTLNNLGYVEFLTNNLLDAEEHLFAATELWKSQLTGLNQNDTYKVSLFDIQQKSYRLLQLVLTTYNTVDKIERALEVAEQGRARALVDLMLHRLSTKPPQLAVEQSLSLEQIRQIAYSRSSTIVEYSITYSPDHRATEIEALALSELLIWVIQPSGEIHFRRSNLLSRFVGKYQSLSDIVEQCLASMDSKGRDIILPSTSSKSSEVFLRDLYQLLVEPIEELLPTNPDNRVILIPQGSLFFVPFSALIDSSNRFLIQKHTFIVAPSIQTLLLTEKQQAKLSRSDDMRSLIVGNPSMPSVKTSLGSQSLPPLPGSESEAREIAAQLGTTALIGSTATKAAVLQEISSARIIHLATHALLDNERGLGSAIALAPTVQDTGWLTAEEISSLQLEAELVVLSACNTGRGRLTGDGVIGLSRSFFAAGAPTLIVSLWSIPDTPTAMLVVEFYQQLQKNLDKAQSLRQAMIAMIEQNFEPKAWAAFTLIGEV